MILVDTSIWVDHFSRPVPGLITALRADQVLMHPYVLGEIALGQHPRHDYVISQLATLPYVLTVRPSEVLAFIRAEKLAGIGIGYVDSHLLASARASLDVRLWSRDKRLASAAERLAVAYTPPPDP